PRRAVGVLALGLEQLFIHHPAVERALDRGAIARHDASRGDGARSGEPAPGADGPFVGGPRLLLEHRLAEIALRNPDVLAERERLLVDQITHSASTMTAAP